MVDLRVGRVDIFLLHALRGGIELSSAESHHFSAHAYPGKDDTTGKTVYQLVVVFPAVADARLGEELLLIAFLLGFARQGIAVGEVEAEAELTDDVVADASFAEILHADGHTVDMVVEDVLEVVGSPLVDDEHRLALALRLAFFVGELALLNFDVVFLRQPAQCLGIGHLLVLHDEANGVASLSAGEALTDATSR